MPALAASSLSARNAVAAPLRCRKARTAASTKPMAVSAKLDASRLAATAAAVILLQATPAFAESSLVTAADADAAGKAEALKLQAALAKKMSTAQRKNFGQDAPQAPRVTYKPRDAKVALASKPDFTVTLPSFGNPFAGLGSAGAPAAAAPKAAESSSESGEGPSLLPVLLLLFSPLAIVQALQVQTVVRLGTQAITGTSATKK